MKSVRYVAAAVACAFLLCASVAVRADDAKITLKGKVVDSSGSPVANASVKVFVPHEKGGAAKPAPTAANRLDDQKPAHEHHKALLETTTDKDGLFSFDLPPGKYVVVAGLKGTGMGKEGPITLAAGQTPDVLTITLKAHKPKAQ